MPDPNQPRENDAVLGGQYPPPASGVILGGLEGVKQRLGRGNPPVTSGTSGSCGSCGSCGTGVPPVMPMRTQVRGCRLGFNHSRIAG